MTALRKLSSPDLNERPENQNNRVITQDPRKSGRKKKTPFEDAKPACNTTPLKEGDQNSEHTKPQFF